MGIRVLQLTKIPIIFHDWWSSLNSEQVLLIDCIEIEVFERQIP